MKKILTLMTAIATLFATSCVKENGSVSVNGNEAEVTLSASLPEFTRATGDGTTAKKLYYAVYDDQWKFLKDGTSDFNADLKATVRMRLVNNKVYNFVFWAQVEGNTFYTINWDEAAASNAVPTVTVSYGSAANDEKRDAFFGQCLNLLVNGAIADEVVYLKRPFAQVNFGADYDEVAEAQVGGFDVTTGAGATVSFAVEAYDKLSLKDGEVLGTTTTVNFTAAPLMNDLTGETLVAKVGETTDPQTGEVVAVTNNYHWVSMNYLLWRAEEGTLTTNTATVTTASGKVVDVKAPQAPVRRNWRTNVVGRLFTDPVEFIVEIQPGFDNEYTEVLPDRQ